jgi:general secretion pathway protein K
MATMIKASTPKIAARRTASDGFIVVAVLWILGALSVLVSIYAVYVVNTASAFAAYDNHIKADALVSAALELTAYQQQSASAQSRPTHGSFSFRLGQANVAVEFRSEAARIDLNAASRSNFWLDCLSRWGRAPMMRKPTAIGSSAGERRHLKTKIWLFGWPA